MNQKNDTEQRTESTDVSQMIADAEKQERKIPRGLFLTLMILVLVIIVMGFLLFQAGIFSGEKKTEYQDPQLNQMQEMVSKIKNLETQMHEKRKEMFGIMKEYRKKTGKDLPAGNVLNLTPEERRILEQKIREEQDASIKSLIQDILARNRDIKSLNQKIREIEKLLPSPVAVREGENHYQIAMNYLINEKGIDKERAQQLIERSMLYDTLLPAFKVWNFYSGDEFGTFITQGDAEISPNTVRRKAKEKLVDARDKALREQESLQEEIRILQEKKQEIISEVNLLSREKNKLIEKLNELTRVKMDFQKKLNSLFYRVDRRDQLKEAGILKGGFLASTKLSDFSPKHFDRSIDLREGQTIVITAKSLEMDSISGIDVFPRFYQEGEDYSITMLKNSKSALVKLLSAEKMKNERMVISVK